MTDAESAREYPDLKPLLLISDIAALLGLSNEGVRSLIRRGQLPAAKIGKRYVVRRPALLAHLKLEEERQRTQREAADHEARRILSGRPARYRGDRA